MRSIGNIVAVTLLMGLSVLAFGQTGQPAGHGPHGDKGDCACAGHPGDRGPGMGPGMGHGMGPDMDDEDGGPGMGPGAKGMHGGHMLAGLDLTKEQSEKMKVVRDKYKPQIKSLHEEIGPMHDAMKKLFESGASAGELRAQHEKIEVSMQKMMNLRFDMILSIYDILTPAQKAKWGKNMPKGPGK